MTQTTPNTLPDMTLADPGTEQQLKAVLHERLLQLSFPAFERLIQQLLDKSGYSQVRLANQTRYRQQTRQRWTGKRQAKQRSNRRGRTVTGGFDLQALTSTDLATELTIAQVKQYQRPVSRRFVDELRGTMLRLGAGQGLMISTSRFSRVAQHTARESTVAPITLIDGNQLIDLMVKSLMGIDKKRDRWIVDESFFAQLEATVTTDWSSLLSALSQPAVVQPEAQLLPTDTNVSKPRELLTNTKAARSSGSKGGGMTGRTHAVVGVNALWLLEAVPRISTAINFGLLAVVAAFGALLPDLDAADSKIKHLRIAGIKPFWWPARLAHRYLGHRGLCHSLVGLAFLGLLACTLIPWWGWPSSLALSLGYASHLVADACTKSGIPLFYPNKYRYHFLPRPLRFTTGSQGEDLLLIGLVATALLLLLRHLPYAS